VNTLNEFAAFEAWHVVPGKGTSCNRALYDRREKKSPCSISLMEATGTVSDGLI